MRNLIFILFVTSQFISIETWAKTQPLADAPAPAPVEEHHHLNPPEAWISLTCRGAVTPPQNHPVVYQDVVTFFVQVDPDKPRPSLKSMAADEKYRLQFDHMTQYCTDKREEIEKNYVLPGNTFLSWYDDYGYSRLIEGEVFIPATNACRNVGQPCVQSSQCCPISSNGPRMRAANVCDLNTNTCTKISTAPQIQ